MKRLGEISDADFFDSATRAEYYAARQQLHMRRSVRAVVFDAANGVFLLNVSAFGYHKLPGGGVECGESYEEALARELVEEIGAKARIIGEVGAIVEHRERYNFTQTSYCYIAQHYGDLAAPRLEENEIAEGFKQHRATSLDEAIERLENDEPQDYMGLFVQKRDVLFLQTARMHKRHA